MSIQSAIEALSPLQYYRLNELTGVVAHDSGSAGINGSFDVGVQLGLPGPEAGTYSAQFNRQLKMAALLNTLGTGDQTLLFWIASQARANSAVCGAGDGFASGGIPARGWAVLFNSTAGNGWSASGYNIGRNGVQNGLTGTTPDNDWHFVAVTLTSGGVGSLYLDGVFVASASSLTRTVPTSSDRCWIGTPGVGIAFQAAHLAWFTSVLTPTQIQGIYDARAGPQQVAYLAGQYSSANNNIYGSSGGADATLTAIYASTTAISGQVDTVATNVGLLTLAVDVVRTTTNSILTWVSGWPDAATSIANWLAPKVNDVLSRLNAGFPSPVSGLSPGAPHVVSGSGYVVSTGRGLRAESFTVPAGWGHYDAATTQWVPRIGELTLMAPDASSDLQPLTQVDVAYDPTVIMYTGTLPSRIYYWVAPGCTLVLTELV